jgi:hypothetical protein
MVANMLAGRTCFKLYWVADTGELPTMWEKLITLPEIRAGFKEDDIGPLPGA